MTHKSKINETRIDEEEEKNPYFTDHLRIPENSNIKFDSSSF